MVLEPNFLKNFLSEVSYSQLILCTESDGPFPGKCNIMDSYHKAIKKYDDIVKEVALSTVILILSCSEVYCDSVINMSDDIISSAGSV